MNCPNHGSADRGAQRMSGMVLWSYCQNEATLPDDDFASLDFDCLGTKIGGKAVFFSLQKHDADDSSEMKTADRDVCNGEHQRAIREAALRPSVFPGKRISTVAFNIADRIPKHIGRAVDGNFSIHRVMHAVNTVPALHEGNVPKWTHDVILNWRKRTKPNGTSGMEVGCVDVQRDAFFSKPIPSDADLIVLFLKIRVVEWNMEGLSIGDQLYGTVF